ncbi:MAG: hypothetical protein ACR2PL_16420 [Dehalococcoidia bacterium]
MTRLRENGDGTIGKRCKPVCGRDAQGVCVNHKGSWDLRSDDEPGKRVARYFKTEREARAALKLAQRANDDGFAVMPKRHTIEELLTEWLRKSVKPARTYGTYRSYRSHVQQHLIPAFGHLDCRTAHSEARR